MDLLEVTKVVQECILHNRKTLNLSHRNLTILPPGLEQVESILHLLLNHNSLLMPPGEILMLKNLQELVLDHNQLTMLPSGISQLSALTTLSVSNNPLGVLPSEIGLLVSLQQLWLVEVQIDALPSELCKLKHLVKLSTRGNNLSFLPDNMGELLSLQWLNVADNRLETLPSSVSKLSSLVYLNLDTNKFREVPQCLCDLKKMMTLSLRENSVCEVSDDIVLGLSLLAKLDLRDTNIAERPPHWKGLSHILLGKTGLDETLHSEITGSSSILDLQEASGSEAGDQEEVEEEQGGRGDGTIQCNEGHDRHRQLNGGPAFRIS